MVFGKQHLSLFVALAFLLVNANAVPAVSAVPPAPTNENVERLRGDLHQFIEMILSCLTNSKMPNQSPIDPAQANQFKQIANSIQEDAGLPVSASTENAEPSLRKFGVVGDSQEETQETSSEVPPNESRSDTNEEPNSSSNSNSKETTEGGVTKENSSEEKENRKEFELQEGDSNNFTPRSPIPDVTDPGSSERSTVMSTTIQPQDSNDIDLRILQPGSKEDTTDNTPEITPSGSSKEDTETPALEGGFLPSIENLLRTHIGQLYESLSNATKQLIPKAGARKSNAEETTPNSSNESKDKSEAETEEIQVRNLVTEAPVTDSSVHPYEALHIYGIQANGPINKIVFEGGAHHPPRPLTVKESNLLKQFIAMVLNTNKMHNPMATFPHEDEIAPRSGSNNRNLKKSPWAAKPVPLELV